MYSLLAVFWDQHEVATRQNRYHLPHSKATGGNTQGGLILPNLFKLIVDNVVPNWLVLVVEDQMVTQEGLGVTVGRYMGLFYIDNGVVRLWDPEWNQGALNMIIVLFCWYGLVENVVKSKSMTFQTVTLQYGMSEEELGQQRIRGGDRYL